ncbi:MAG: alpha/beta hydrolase family protein [Archangium sp.]
MHWLDRLSIRFLRRTSIFERGWGDLSPFEARAREVLSVRDASPLDISWSPPKRESGLTVQDGVAKSPLSDLPDGAATIHVRRVLTPRAPKRRVVVPPSWGDAGYAPRMWLTGALVAQGLEPWLLEGAYFGARASPLDRVEDFLRMGLTHVEETRALLATHLHENAPTSLAGYSMAGQLGSIAVATMPHDIPLIAMAAPPTADVVFVEGPLSAQVTWSALGDDARARLPEMLRKVSLLEVPPPRSSKRTVVLNEGDGIVNPLATEKIAAHWNVEPRRVKSGHLGAYALERRALQRLIAEALL